MFCVRHQNWLAAFPDLNPQAEQVYFHSLPDLSDICLLERLDVYFPHLKHRFHGSARFFGVLVTQEFGEDRWDDLPGHAVLIREPGALPLLRVTRLTNRVRV